MQAQWRWELSGCFAYLMVFRKSSGILWQNPLHGITHGDFGLRG
jgi:hypothetical protein